MSKYRVIKDLEDHFLFKSKLASVNDEDIINLKYFPKTEFFRKRVANEFSLIGRVEHENVLIPKGSGEDEIGTYVVTEYCEYGSLAGRFKEKGRLDYARVLQVAELALKGLSALHSKDIVHGNIRPRSLYIGNDGHLKLGDMGFTFEPSDSKNVKPEALLYIAPEYFSEVGAKKESDLYSLGLTLYHLYYGRPAFVSVDNNELIRLHKESEISETESSHELQLFIQFLKKMTAVKVEERYSSVEEALVDLMALVHNKKELPSCKMKAKNSEEPLSKAWLAGAFISGAAALVFIVLNILKS